MSPSIFGIQQGGGTVQAGLEAGGLCHASCHAAHDCDTDEVMSGAFIPVKLSNNCWPSFICAANSPMNAPGTSPIGRAFVVEAIADSPEV